MGGGQEVCVREGSLGVCILEEGKGSLGAFALGEREGIWIVCIWRTIKPGIMPRSMHIGGGKEPESWGRGRKSDEYEYAY